MISKIDSYNMTVSNINKTNNSQDIKAVENSINITDIQDTININKVELIRNAILNGEYELDMRETAKKLISKEFLS